jgi:hypothetical protein
MNEHFSSGADAFEQVHNFFIASMDNTATDEQFENLERLLLENDDACDLYIRYAQTTVLLPRTLRGVVAERSSCDANACAPSIPNVAPILDDLGPTAGKHTPPFEAFPYLVLALIAYLATLAAWHFRPVGHEVAANGPRTEIESFVDSPKSPAVGRVTAMAYWKWSPGMNSVTCRDRVFVGQQFKLDAGLLEITYHTGAKVILEGPVVYEVSSDNGGLLLAGKLTGKVATKAARGFTVRTPTATLVDLGTEFAAEVRPNGTVEAVVFAGEVKLATIATPTGHGTELSLKAGQAARVLSVASEAAATDAIAASKAASPSEVVPLPDASQTATPTIQSIPPTGSERFARSVPAVSTETLVGPTICNGSFETPAVGPQHHDDDAGNLPAGVYATIHNVVPDFWNPTASLQTKGNFVRNVAGEQYVVLQSPLPSLSTCFDGAKGHPAARVYKPHTIYVLTADVGANTANVVGVARLEGGPHRASRRFAVTQNDVMSSMPVVELNTDVSPEFVGKPITLTFTKIAEDINQLYVDNVVLKAMPASAAVHDTAKP